MTASRVSSRNGTFFSGDANVCQRISPRCAEFFPPLGVPSERLVFGPELLGPYRSICVRRVIAAFFGGGTEGHPR